MDQSRSRVCEMHPRLAEKLRQWSTDDFVKVESRRGNTWLCAQGGKDHPAVTRSLFPLPLASRPLGKQLTVRAIDPVSNIPEFKICAVRSEASDRSYGRNCAARSSRPEAFR